MRLFRLVSALAFTGSACAIASSSAGPPHVDATAVTAIPAAGTAGAAPAEAVGDTLTVLQRPIQNIPSFVLPGWSLSLWCEAPPATSDWSAALVRGPREVPLELTSAFYDAGVLWWRLTAVVPAGTADGLYDLRMHAGGEDDVSRHAVKVLSAYRTSYDFVQITDTHLPTHAYYYEPGSEADSTEMADLSAVIEDVNLINAEFVLVTGDLVNEGELEEFLLRRYYSKAKRILAEFEVPVFLTAGNHDLGGWSSTPPSDGTARRDWWRFFGWKRLADPPPGAPSRTQDYSFDYGPVHFVALEAYINYDGWRSEIYGPRSFTPSQMAWLSADLAAASASATQVLFYHDDFDGEIGLASLGVEMALWGHVHSDNGSLTQMPYNLSTRPTCDGRRAYRVVHVDGGALTPYATLDAGAGGEKLRTVFSPANDGTHMSVMAAVVNEHPVRFENALVRFLMPDVEGDIRVAGGRLVAAEETGGLLLCSVQVDLQPNGAQAVSVTIDSTGGVPDPATALRLEQNLPNPFSSPTLITFALPSAGPVRLEIFTPSGRRVRTLVNENLEPGPHVTTWDGSDDRGRPLPSGAYFYRLRTRDGDRTRQLSLVR